MIFPLVMGFNDLGVFLFELFPFLHIFLLLFPFVYLVGGFGGLEALIGGVVFVFFFHEMIVFYLSLYSPKRFTFLLSKPIQTSFLLFFIFFSLFLLIILPASHTCFEQFGSIVLPSW